MIRTFVIAVLVIALGFLVGAEGEFRKVNNGNRDLPPWPRRQEAAPEPRTNIFSIPPDTMSAVGGAPTLEPGSGCAFTANLGSPPAPAATGTMTTRLLRGDAQGTCSANPFPGNTGSGSFPFDAYTLTNSSPSPVCVSAALTVNSQSNANYQIAAFLAPFVGSDITNPSRYLGDPGISSGTPSSLITSFQFTVPANTSFAIVVFAVNGTAELGGNYTIQVMSTSSFCPLPRTTPTPPPTKGTSVAYQIDATHSGAQFDTIVPPLTQRWSRDLGGQISYPLIAGGRIFVTVANQNTNGTKLYALDEANGATLWGPVDLGGSFFWSNAAYDAGRVFALNFDGVLRAFDAASGGLLWSRQLPDQHAFSSPPTASGGVVYVEGSGSGTTVYAVDEQDGTVIWNALLFAGSNSSPAVTPTGVVVSYSCNQVYNFSPQNGSLIWQHSGPCSGGGGSTPVLFDGRLYVRDFGGTNLMLDAPTGAVLSTFSAASSPPAFSGSRGFFLTGTFDTGFTLEARDAYTGAVQWSFTGDGTLRSAPIINNGYVYIGSGSGKVYALDASTGANVWTGNLGAAVQLNESPVSRPHTGLGAGDGLVVVPASTLLVAFETTQPIQLLLKDSASLSNEVAALDSVLFLRDPFPVVNTANLLNTGVDRNTRVILFVKDLQFFQGEKPSAVVIHLTDNSGRLFDVSAEDVRQVAGMTFSQVVFRLPDGLAEGTCTVRLTAHAQVSNIGIIRIGAP
jgi:outer membrane protein assembly factor BamB